MLKRIPLLGNVMIKRLIRHFNTPENIFSADLSQLMTIQGIGKETAANIARHQKFKSAAARALEKVLRFRFGIVTLTDAAYPKLLREIIDPPPFLTFKGTLDNRSPCISIVGSRSATSYGLSTARHLAAALAAKGFQIVSGLARGVDAMAHQGALDRQGRTIAVLGSGLNNVYPRQNRQLCDSIALTGTVFSEFTVDAQPQKEHFPVRNRCIAGLSCGTVVVEAARKSGSLITARLAGEYNREVFAVPGSIKSVKSQGTHALLKQGAHLVENEMDIIDELFHFIHENRDEHRKNGSKQKAALEKMPKNDYPILELMEPYPVHIDTLIEKSRLDCSAVTDQLLNLELEGMVQRHPGNYYSISEGKH